MLLDPYYLVWACVRLGVTLFIVVRSKRSDIFSTIIKLGSHGSIGAVKSHARGQIQFRGLKKKGVDILRQSIMSERQNKERKRSKLRQ